jgi:hypothetical protein
MRRIAKVVPTITVGDVKRVLERLDDRMEFRVSPLSTEAEFLHCTSCGNQILVPLPTDPIAVRDVAQTQGNNGQHLVLVILRTQ